MHVLCPLSQIIWRFLKIHFAWQNCVDRWPHHCSMWPLRTVHLKRNPLHAIWKIHIHSMTKPTHSTSNCSQNNPTPMHWKPSQLQRNVMRLSHQHLDLPWIIGSLSTTFEHSSSQFKSAPLNSKHNSIQNRPKQLNIFLNGFLPDPLNSVKWLNSVYLAHLRKLPRFPPSNLCLRHTTIYYILDLQFLVRKFRSVEKLLFRSVFFATNDCRRKWHKFRPWPKPKRPWALGPMWAV